MTYQERVEALTQDVWRLQAEIDDINARLNEVLHNIKSLCEQTMTLADLMKIITRKVDL